ncbi:hypothetical protein PHYBLDRAFT_61974 [Phycomyces blakesleeanus NRRL 1555(-)]|uniref:Uncharacterized protein n=1 Tax=Phycomyces blakesleeanus (strain ATCC 8743b / DSM 1359 / FGSC 10004 / NBRC 33097 / NRRL 1555) TaxID=763407 RepID=A0A167R609_PHYB8|nr:hypothetical protein PHYBLDRAFT_61974 [Phycomyces blakesleeanus NRRL 1555(-)]OAD80929.1 hypothetical protein PHYBLDRAFT_61974 [Phycomyces blakesleeanus NRRL 1555(-)]|eukprot:XP_018298969.1 hypothetical protein PHYBLDRAFT_61974 [Phycomyces blakesleeanus NRRL 1555(-)]
MQQLLLDPNLKGKRVKGKGLKFSCALRLTLLIVLKKITMNGDALFSNNTDTTDSILPYNHRPRTDLINKLVLTDTQIRAITLDRPATYICRYRKTIGSKLGELLVLVSQVKIIVKHLMFEKITKKKYFVNLEYRNADILFRLDLILQWKSCITTVI